jgi:hypothetical protein
MTITTDLKSVEFDLEEVQGLSLDLLTHLEKEGCSIGEGVAAAALTVGRLMSPHTLKAIEEIKFVQDLLEWVSMYYVPGGIN